MKRNTRPDERALAVGGILAFLALLGIAALLYTLFNPAAASIFDTTLAATSSSDATSVIEERQQIWGFVLFIALFFGALLIIRQAVLESGRGF